MRNETPLTPRIPLNLTVHIIVPDQFPGRRPVNAHGGVAAVSDVTIVGHTTPGSLVFLDGPDGANYQFEEAAFPTDAHGNFSYTLHLTKALTNTEYLVIDPFGQQIIKALPVRLAGADTA